jgi:branched-chain amino acid transport system permease protein
MPDFAGLGQQLWLGLLSGVVLTVFSTGLVLLFGVMRVVNMAHGALYMLGAMFTYTAQSHLGVPFVPAALLSVVAVGAFGVMLNRVALQPMEHTRAARRGGTESAALLETMVLSFVVYNAAVLTFGAKTRSIDTGIEGTFTVLGAAITAQGLVLLVVGAVSVVTLQIFFAKTMLGRSMRAAADDPKGASLAGVDIRRMYDYAWLLASVLAALAGVLIAPLSAASPTMGQDTLITGFAVVVAAGLTSFSGVVVAALGLGMLGALFAQFVSTYYQDVFIFGLMVLVLLARPTGLFGAREAT